MSHNKDVSMAVTAAMYEKERADHLETRAALESERQARTTADANTNALVAMTQNALAQESAALVQERAALAQERAAHAKTQLTLDNERAAHAVTRAERNEAVQAAYIARAGPQ